MCAVKQSLIGQDVIGADIDDYLVHQKIWNSDGSDALACLGRGNDVFAIDSGLCFGNMDAMVGNVDIARCKRQQFALPHTGPVEQFEGGEGFRIRRKLTDE